MLLAGVRDFPAQMGAGSPTSNFTAESRFGVQFLLRMWNDKTSTLYYQVGIGSGNANTTGDHDIWRLPQDDDTFGGTDPRYRYIRNRPVFRAAPPGAADQPEPRRPPGRCVRANARRSSARPTRSSRTGACVPGRTSTTWPTPSPSGDLLTVIPFSFYPEDEWFSDMELGATELALGDGRVRPPLGPAARVVVLPGRCGALGLAVHAEPVRRGRHAQPVRRLRVRAFRSVSRDRGRGRSRRARDHPGGAARRHGEGAGRRAGPGRDRSRSGSASRGRGGTRRPTAPGSR